MPQSIADRIRQIMGDVLEIDENSINDDSSMDDINSWDSLNHVSLVIAIEEELGMSFDVTEIEQMVTFYDIVATVEQKT